MTQKIDPPSHLSEAGRAIWSEHISEDSNAEEKHLAGILAKLADDLDNPSAKSISLYSQTRDLLLKVQRDRANWSFT